MEKQLIEAFQMLNSEDKSKILNYAKHLQSKENEVPGHAEYCYLNQLSDKTKKFIIKIIETENLNLWHSANAIIETTKSTTVQEVSSKYFNKYVSARPYLQGNEDIVNELFRAINEKRIKNGKKHLG